MESLRKIHPGHVYPRERPLHASVRLSVTSSWLLPRVVASCCHWTYRCNIVWIGQTSMASAQWIYIHCWAVPTTEEPSVVRLLSLSCIMPDTKLVLLTHCAHFNYTACRLHTRFTANCCHGTYKCNIEWIGRTTMASAQWIMSNVRLYQLRKIPPLFNYSHFHAQCPTQSSSYLP